MPDNPRQARSRRQLDELANHGLRRTMRPPSGIDLSSNDYLGLAADVRLRQAFVRGAESVGVGSTGSRLLRGHREAFAEAEAAFAVFKGTERALFFSSGYLANLAVLTTFGERGDLLCSDERNHASLIDGSRLSRARVVITRHADANAVDAVLRDDAGDGLGLVVVESLYSMDGDSLDLPSYLGVCRQRGATLVVDEAHAVGVRGARGTGLLEEQGIDANECLSINTAGKALGVGGAFVAGPEWAIESLIQRARSFIFTTAAPPAMAAAILESLAIVASEPERRDTLKSRSRHLRRELRALGLAVDDSDSHIIPIVLGDNDRAVAVAEDLQAKGFDVRAIRPPTVPTGTARLRVSVNATIDESSADRFVGSLAAALSTYAATADV